MPSRRAFLAGTAGALTLSARTAAQSTATAPSRTWSRTYAAGGSAITDLVPLDDGYALVGSAGTDAAVRGWVATADADGRSRGTTTLGDTGTRLVAGAPADGGVIATGRTNVRDQPTTRHRDPYAASITVDDSDEADVEWARSYQPALPDGGATAIAPVDGGSVLAGSADTTDDESDGVPWAAGIDDAGTRRWTWRGDEVGSVTDAVAVDGGVVLVGSVADAEIAWALGLDPAGSRRWGWRADHGGSRFEAVAPAPDGGVVAVGRRGFEPTRGVGWLASLGTDGLRWQRTYSRDEWNWHRDIAALGDGYVLAGNIGDVNAGERSAWLLRVDADGAARWEQRAENGTEAFCVRASPDGGVLVAGSVEADDGDRAWLAQFGGNGGGSGVQLPSLPSVPDWAAPFGVGAVAGAAGTALLRRREPAADGSN